MEHDGRVDGRPLPFLTEDELEYWQQMPGFLLPSAAERLYQAAAEAPTTGRIVELGSFAGKSLVCLAYGAKSRAGVDEGSVTSIDLSFHDRWSETVDRFGLSGMVDALEMSSLDAADGWRAPISLLYIDAHHGLAHARADFVVWEMFLVEGGVVALDDTAGLYPGCTLQVEMAISGGAFEVIDDVGGVTFLRKLAPLFDGIGIAPLGRDTVFATVAAASAWSGAMDPQLRLPNPVQHVLGTDIIDTRLRETLSELEWIARGVGDLRDELLPTVTYVEAVTRLRLGQPHESLELLERLGDTHGQSFFHYDLEIHPIGLLRHAQVLDLLGRRDDAVAIYELVRGDGPVDEVAAAAEEGIASPFVLVEPTPGRLLREYVLGSPFDRFRRSGARR